MVFKIILFLSSLSLYSGSEFGCYWNNSCAYPYFGSKTPYDTIRGDIRDLKKSKDISGCEAVSLWSLIRHGNRSPRKTVTRDMKAIADLKDQIAAAYDQGRSQLCAQDIDDLRKWSWNDISQHIPETGQYVLTDIGYEEMYSFGARVKAAFPELMKGGPGDYYFRPAKDQRALKSGVAYLHGLNDGCNISFPLDESRQNDEIITPFELCPEYRRNKNNNSILATENAAFQKSAEYVAIKNSLQKRLGISYNITTANVSSFYELCRFSRSWDSRLRSPWCAVFSEEDLMVLEYTDDLKHYYIYGYGSWMNPQFGEVSLKDLYKNFESAAQGQGKKMVTYFTHNIIIQMVFTALGLNKDSKPLKGEHRDKNRLWRTAFNAPIGQNFMVILNRCQESDTQSLRVQMFIGEKVTPLCPLEGCTWHRIKKMLQPFANASVDLFCT